MKLVFTSNIVVFLPLVVKTKAGLYTSKERSIMLGLKLHADGAHCYSLSHKEEINKVIT